MDAAEREGLVHVTALLRNFKQRKTQDDADDQKPHAIGLYVVCAIRAIIWKKGSTWAAAV